MAMRFLLRERKNRCGSRGLLAATKGAVLAEFLAAMPALLTTYLCFLQMAHVYAAGTVMRHATVVCARYASVAFPTNFIPNAADHARADGARNASWLEAVNYALGPWKGAVVVKSVDVQYGGGNPWGDVNAKVDYEYSCRVPVASRIVCRNAVVNKTIRASIALNGARYAL
jgi:hypothetical protein